MSKYIQLKNKQRLAKALAEINMTVEEAKQWLADAADEQVNTAKQCMNQKVCINNQDVEDQLAFAFWYNEHADEYSDKAEKCVQSRKSCPTSRKYADAVSRLVKDIESAAPPALKLASNVAFVPGSATIKPRLIIAGQEVTGNYRLNYSCDNGPVPVSALIVEFIDPAAV